MSTFLGYESYLINLGASLADVHNTIRDALVARGWQVVHDTNSITISNTLGTLGTVAKAFDGVYGTSNEATSSNSLPLWVGCQYSGNVAVRRVAIYGSASSNTYSPKDFTIDYSDNGSSWTTALTVTNCTSWAFVKEPLWFDVPDSGSHAYWRVNITAVNGGSTRALTEVAFFDINNTRFSNVSSGSYFDVIPPSSETIGDTYTRDLVRFKVSATAITVGAVAESKLGMPQCGVLWEKTAGNVQAGVTINGVTINQDAGTMNAANTAKQNLRYLYDALRSSADAEIANWNFEYSLPVSQNGNDSNDYIIITRKTLSLTPYTISPNTNINGSSRINSIVPAGFTPSYSANFHTTLPDYSLTIDLTNGFIYYLQINSRGIGLATKTNTSFYGPIHACYGDHQKALDSKPSGATCGVIELLVGSDSASTNLDATASPSRYWFIMDKTFTTGPSANGNYFDNKEVRHTLVDGQIGNTNTVTLTLPGSNIWSNTSTVGNDFQVHKISNPTVTLISAALDGNSGVNYNGLCPMVDLSDWYKFVGTATNEALLLIADTQTYTTLGANVLVTDTPTSVQVASTSGFPAAGFFTVGSEVFQYTGTSGGNTFTGVTRAKYGTIAQNQFTGDKVYPCIWFTVINGGALMCGYTKPS